MTVNCKHPDWQAEVSCGPVRPGGRISPGRTGNIGLFVGTGLRSLKRESSILRWCYTFWGFPGRGARSVVLYSIKSIFKSTLPIVQRSELRCFSLVSSINYRQENWTVTLIVQSLSICRETRTHKPAIGCQRQMLRQWLSTSTALEWLQRDQTRQRHTSPGPPSGDPASGDATCCCSPSRVECQNC